MSTQPQLISDSMEHRGYEIRYKTVGPVGAGDSPPHYKASVAIYHKGTEVEGSLLHLSDEFTSREFAEKEAQEQGKDLVNQYC